MKKFHLIALLAVASLLVAALTADACGLFSRRQERVQNRRNARHPVVVVESNQPQAKVEAKKSAKNCTNPDCPCPECNCVDCVCDPKNAPPAPTEPPGAYPTQPAMTSEPMQYQCDNGRCRWRPMQRFRR